ncbi:MAG: response regulator [Arenicella sp.]
MNKLTMMIVDDSFVIRAVISNAHNSKKYDLIAVATNGEEAISQYLKYKPQIVTMDLTMPKMDGLQCIEKLIALNPNIQIIVVSALNDEATGIKALKLGAAGFVTKPFTEEDICEAIDIVAEYIEG